METSHTAEKRNLDEANQLLSDGIVIHERDLEVTTSPISEKTPAQMLLRQDGIIRYSRDTIISLHVIGAHPVPDFLFVSYGHQLTSIERSECKSLACSAPKNKFENKNHRENKNHHEVDLEELSPNECEYYLNLFRYCPAQPIDPTSPAGVLHKARKILNKLSVESFERLSNQFLKIGMVNEETMGPVVDLLISKAQLDDECFLYADLCKKVTDKWSSVNVAATSGGVSPDLGKNFRVCLLERCQQEFQKDRQAAVDAILDRDISVHEKKVEISVLAQRYRGHIRFLGEIYMRDLLKAAIVYRCIEDLLNIDDEEKLSCLCMFMKLIGKKLEAYDTKKNTRKVQEYFQTISKLATDKGISKAIRFIFQKLIEMRENNWIAQKAEVKAKKSSKISADGASGTPSAGQFESKASQSIDAQAAPVLSSFPAVIVPAEIMPKIGR